MIRLCDVDILFSLNVAQNNMVGSCSVAYCTEHCMLMLRCFFGVITPSIIFFYRILDLPNTYLSSFPFCRLSQPQQNGNGTASATPTSSGTKKVESTVLFASSVLWLLMEKSTMWWLAYQLYCHYSYAIYNFSCSISACLYHALKFSLFKWLLMNLICLPHKMAGIDKLMVWKSFVFLIHWKILFFVC